jgi:hypothetical protein
MELLPKIEDPTWVCLMRAPARRALDDASLVLAAVEIPHEIEFDGHQWCLLVPAARETAAHDELQEFQHENRPRSVGPAPVVAIDSGWAGVLGYLLVIWGLPWLENIAAFGWDWRDSGVMTSGTCLAIRSSADCSACLPGGCSDPASPGCWSCWEEWRVTI